MPIRTLTQDLVREIIDSHGQITKLNLSNNGEKARAGDAYTVLPELASWQAGHLALLYAEC